MGYDINGNIVDANNSYYPFLHISFDDSACLGEIANGDLSSIFDNPVISLLKTLHEKYGAVFSLYPDRNDTSGFYTMPEKYKSNFIECSDWLKIGFHCYANENLKDVTEQEAISRYNTFASVIFERTGGINSIDRFPRLNNIECNIEACQGLIKANAGIVGLLGSSAIRNSYYLDSNQSEYLRNNGILYDTTAGIVFLSTAMCLDWFIDGYSQQTAYDVPTETRPYDELAKRHSLPIYGKVFNMLEIYGHEANLYSGGTVNQTYSDFLRQVCEFGRDFNYAFDFPQNRIPNITSLGIN